MGITSVSSTTFRVFIFMLVFVFTAWWLIQLKIWSFDFTKIFFRSGRWLELIVVALSVYVISEILTKLLQWFFRAGVK